MALTAKIARWALFIDFQSCYHNYFEPRQAQDAPADPRLRPLIAQALGSPLVWFASLKNAAGRHHERLVQGYAIARVRRHLWLCSSPIAFNLMRDRRQLSAITWPRIFVAVVAVLSTVTQHKCVTTKAKPAVVSTDITPMIFVRQ
jgi:hypothetical protein